MVSLVVVSLIYRRGLNTAPGCVCRRGSTRRGSEGPATEPSSGGVLQFDDHLAEIIAVKEADKGFRCVFEAVDNGFPPFDFSVIDPGAHFVKERRVALLMVTDDKTLQGEAPADRKHQIIRSRGRLGGVVLPDHTTEGDATVEVHVRDGRLQMITAYIVEVDVDAVGAVVDEFGLYVFDLPVVCLLYTSPSPRDATLSRMPSSA